MTHRHFPAWRYLVLAFLPLSRRYGMRISPQPFPPFSGFPVLGNQVGFLERLDDAILEFGFIKPVRLFGFHRHRHLSGKVR